jgi:sulfate permease, SulP family
MQFNFKHFKGDLFGGLTAGVVALPLALAFGEQSGLGASAGLFGAAFIAFFAAMFGGTSTQISGPTAPMTVLSASIVSAILIHREGDLSHALPLILLVFFLAGIFQIALGMIKLGSYIRFIPQTVVSGFMTGIGVIILITQVLPAIGYIPAEDESHIQTHWVAAERILVEDAFLSASEAWVEESPDSTGGFDLHHHMSFSQADITNEAKGIIRQESQGVLGAIRYIPLGMRNINWLELLLCLSTIAIIYGFKRITTAIPSALVALVVITSIALFMDLPYRSISRIEAGLPTLQWSMFTWPQFSNLGPYVLTALILALLGAIDSLLTSVVADNMTRTQHEPNKELIGQGIGNAIASLFGGLPGAGATIRTVVNIQAGGKTRLSGMIAGVLLFTTIVVLGPIASQIPAAVLAGILITVGIGVMDYKGLRGLLKMGWGERIVLLAVLILTVFWQLVYAVAVGLVIASFQFMKYMGDWSSSQFRLHIDPEEDVQDVLIKSLHGPLFFGNASALAGLRSQIPVEIDQVVIDMTDVHFVDQSGVAALEDTVLAMKKSGKSVKFKGLSGQPEKRIRAASNLLDD